MEERTNKLGQNTIYTNGARVNTLTRANRTM